MTLLSDPSASSATSSTAPAPSNRLRTWAVVGAALFASGGAGCKERGFNAGTKSIGERPDADNPGMQFDSQTPPSVVLADPEALKAVLADADKKHAGDAFCDDWQIAIHLLALVQVPVGREGQNLPADRYARLLKECPASYSEMARSLRALQLELKDYHTGFKAPDAHLRVVPTLTTCRTQDVCADVVGSVFIPMITEAGRRAFAFAETKDGTRRFFEVKQVDGRDAGAYYNELVRDEKASKLQAANNGQLSFHLFLKHILDGLPQAPVRLLVQSVGTGALGQLDVSYARKPERAPKGDLMDAIFSYEVNGNYGCDAVTPGSRAEVGSCALEGGRGFVWLRDFTASSYDTLNAVRKLLSRHPAIKTTGKPLILDLRGNGGGDPQLAGELACMLGGKDAAERIGRRELVASYWPEAFQLDSGKEVAVRDLDISGNGDLRYRKKGWKVSSKETALRPDAKRIGFFERFKGRRTLSSAERCVGLHAPDFKDLRWIVLSNGREYSATENFMSFIAPIDARFKILGQVSMGGTGAPTLIKLPSTGMELRLSQARHFDTQTRSWDIEAIGVRPDAVVETEKPTDFERYLDAVSKGTARTGLPAASQGKDLRPFLLRHALWL